MFTISANAPALGVWKPLEHAVFEVKWGDL
jgi:hypothetical protein